MRHAARGRSTTVRRADRRRHPRAPAGPVDDAEALRGAPRARARRRSISLPNVAPLEHLRAPRAGAAGRAAPEGIFDATHLRWFTLRDASELARAGRRCSTAHGRRRALAGADRGSRVDALRAAADADVRLPARDRPPRLERLLTCSPHASDRPLPDLQGLRRPRPLRATTSTATPRRRSVAASRARSADLSGKPTSELKVGLGRDMRLSAPELAARYRDGHDGRGRARASTPARSGTEMLYWLVGSRDLDGGLMCTASHNPKAYTGAKMVERGAVALSGDRGLAEVRAHIENGLGEAPGGGSFEEVDIYEDFQRARAEGHRHGRDPAAEGRRSTAATAWPGRWSARSSTSCRLDLVDHLLDPRRRVPRPRAQPAAAREPRVHHRARSSRRAPTSASPGTATPTAASSSTSTGEFVPGDFLTALLAASRAREASRAPTSSTTSAPPARSPTPSSASAAARSSTASATPSSRPACATRAASSAARSPATTTSRTSTTPTPARSPRC